MSEILCKDAFFLAHMRAARMAKEAGVSDEEWKRVSKIVEQHYARRRKMNPLSGMF